MAPHSILVRLRISGSQASRPARSANSSAIPLMLEARLPMFAAHTSGMVTTSRARSWISTCSGREAPVSSNAVRTALCSAASTPSSGGCARKASMNGLIMSRSSSSTTRSCLVGK